MKASDIIKVKNISSRGINLSKGRIESGKTGEATRAELQCHSKVIEVADKKEVPAKKQAAKKEESNSLI